jgi:hypothetical protein
MKGGNAIIFIILGSLFLMNFEYIKSLLMSPVGLMIIVYLACVMLTFFIVFALLGLKSNGEYDEKEFTYIPNIMTIIFYNFNPFRYFFMGVIKLYHFLNKKF